MQDAVEEAMNEDYEPTDDDEAILNVLKDEPGGRANPLLIRRETGLSKQRVGNSLRQLVAAGWVEKPVEGLYDFVGDPRDQ